MIVLAVDDDDDDIEILSECLHTIDASISLCTARNGKEALSHLDHSEHLPDVIFLDMNMPLMTGKECLTAIRANNRFDCIKIILFSTAINLSDPALREYSNVRAMNKPYHIERYLFQLESLIAGLKDG
jgi:CheY-like chemotaxis protein